MTDATEHDESPTEVPAVETADGATGEAVVETPESADPPPVQVTDAPESDQDSGVLGRQRW